MQRLNIAKAFLQNTFTNSLQFLNDSKYWRDEFEDQLKSNYKEHLFAGIEQLLRNELNGKGTCNELWDSKIGGYVKKLEPIKKNYEYNLAQKHKVRMIENPNKRVVNFMFVNPFPVRLNEFSNRLRKYFDGKLENYVTSLDAKISAYIESIKNDEIEEPEEESNPFPIRYIDTKHLTFDISAVGRIGLSWADDPFFKLPPTHQKYFPEIIAYSHDGSIIEVIDESKAGIETITKGTFDKAWRDSHLKINDDRKAWISLMLQKEVQMVVLVVRSRDTNLIPDVKKGQFDRAQFRLFDDETNQTLDEAVIKDLRLTVPTPENEGDEENKEPQQEPEPEEDEDQPKKAQPQNIIVVGRVALNEGKWIYERYNYVYKEDKHQDFFQMIGKLEVESRTYIQDKENLIREEEKALKESREAAAQAAMAKAAGKKTKKETKGKKDAKGGNDKEEAKEESKVEEEKKENVLDIDFMPGFREALQGIYSTVFGPVTFKLKDSEWNVEHTSEAIMKTLKSQLGDKIKDCIHGFEFRMGAEYYQSKNKKKRITKISKKGILKYSRNIQNLQIMPIVPPEKVVIPPKPEGEEGAAEGENNEAQ